MSKKDASEWLKGYNSNYLECRVVGHQWKVKEAGFSFLTLECRRCPTVREDFFSASGRVLEYRRYVFPEGYSKPKDIISPEKVDVRREMLRRYKNA